MSITTAKNWKDRTARPIELELPSGLTVLVRRPPLQMWIAGGRLPESLVKTMLEASDPMQAAERRMTPDQLKELFRFMRETILSTVVAPKIVEQPESDDELSPDDVPLDDAMFIFQWAMAGGQTPAAQLEKARTDARAQGEQIGVDASDLQRFRSF